MYLLFKLKNVWKELIHPAIVCLCLVVLEGKIMSMRPRSGTNAYIVLSLWHMWQPAFGDTKGHHDAARTVKSTRGGWDSALSGLPTGPA